MPTVPVMNQQGEQVGELELSDKVFATEVKEHLFYDVVRMQLARRRSANPATKTRSLVSGGGKKPYRQKGTGRARHGTTRAPQFRGGGVAFGPNGRRYDIRLNKKVRKAALRSALSLRLAQSELVVVDTILLENPKTRLFVGIAERLLAKTALFVIDGVNENVMRSARNIPALKVLPAGGLNVYDILKHSRLVLTKPAVLEIEERLKA